MTSNPSRYGWVHLLLRALLHPWVTRVRTLNADFETLRALQAKGQLLFVGYAPSMIDFMVINEQLKRNGMKPLELTHGIHPFLVLPLGKAFRVWSSRLFKGDARRREIALQNLCEAAAGGGNGLVFLKKGSNLLRSDPYFYQGFFGKIALAPNGPSKTYLVPTSVFLTRMRKKNTRRTMADVFFGTYNIPGRIRKLYQLLVSYSKGGTVFSRHIDLHQEVGKWEGMGEGHIEKRLRWTLLFHLNNEDRAYRGPNKRSRERKVRRILRERRLNQELKKVAERQGRTMESVLKEAGKNLHEIASDTSERVINLLRIFFDFIWARTLEGIDIRQRDLHMMRQLTKRGPVLVLPCHRSHVDYLVMAYVFEKYGLNFPRIAAGDNLSKWPLGPVLRRAGAFFLRRSFKGETIFPLVFDAYIRHVLRESHIMIFFTEGTRSRTGKLLQPKMGMLYMVLDAWREGVVEDLPIVPVTIDYGKVFEGQAYLRERSGEEKTKENLRSVLQSRKVLKRKHGILRLRFGEPINLARAEMEAGYQRATMSKRDKVHFLNKLSYRVLNEINRAVTLTAGNIVAGLLLGNPRRGISLTDLNALFVISVRFFRSRNVELAFAEQRLELALKNALETFVQWETLVRVEVGNEVVVNVPENKRAEMEYYKNNGLHFVLDLALFCMAFRSLSPERRTMSNIKSFSQEVYALLDREFLIRGEFPDEEQLQKAFKTLEHIGALKRSADRVSFGEYKIGRDLVMINAFQLLNLLESYFVVAEVAIGHSSNVEIDKKVFLRQCMVKARLLYAVGTLRRMESVNHVTFTNALDKFNKLAFIQFKNRLGHKQVNVLVSERKREAFLEARNRLFEWINQLI